MRKNLNLLSWSLRFLNFNENKLILDTNAKDIRIVIIFFLFTKIPRKPIAKTEVDKIKK